MEPINITEGVKYTFAQAELVQIARDQARHMGAMTRLEEEFDNIKAEQKSKVTRLEADISDCTRRVTSGYEIRQVKCIVLKFRPDNEHKLVVRTDNGRVVRKIKLASDEKQITLTEAVPETFAWECDLFQDADGDIAECVAEFVPLYAKEAEQLKDVVKLRALRKQIEAPTKKKK